MVGMNTVYCLWQIAIMDCIVNGPGEMADADFGYVGGAPGKIDLYVGKVSSVLPSNRVLLHRIFQETFHGYICVYQVKPLINI